MPTDTVGTRQADAVVGPSSDQGHANEQLSYAQGTIELVQNIRPDCTSKGLQSRSPSANIEDGNPSNFTTDAQPQLSHNRGFLNPQDYYVQDDEWRAQQPSGDYEEEFPDSQDGSL